MLLRLGRFISGTRQALIQNIGSEPVGPVTDAKIAIVGGTEAERWSSAYSGAGDSTFNTELGSHFNTKDVQNVGITGAAITDTAAGAGGGFWDVAGAATDTAFTNTVSAIDTAFSSEDPTHIVLHIPELDTNGTLSDANYKTALTGVCNAFQAEYPDVKIIFVSVGRNTSGGSNSGFQTVRYMTEEVIADLSFVYFGCETYHLALDGTVNQAQASIESAAEWIADRILAIESYIAEEGTLGPSVSLVRHGFNIKSSTTCYAEIDQDGLTDTDFTPEAGNAVTGWELTVDGDTKILTGNFNSAIHDEGETWVQMSYGNGGDPPSGGDSIVVRLMPQATANTAQLLRDSTGKAVRVGVFEGTV